MGKRARAKAGRSPARTETRARERAKEPSSRRSLRWLPPALILAVAIGIYANTLSLGFTLDDDPLILNNPRIADLGYIHYLLFDHELWRPLKRITLMVDYALWGRENPAGFHATNVAFHAAACLALYAFCLALGLTRLLAAVVALLFAVHPIHAEAVANISHRKESMSLLFYLLGFIAYLRGRPANPSPGPIASLLRRVSGTAGAGVVRGEFVVYAAACYLLGMMSKEVGAVMFPVTVLAYELIVAKEPWRERVPRLAGFAAGFAAVLLLFSIRGYVATIPRRFSAEQIQWVSQSQTASYGRMVLVVPKAFAVNVLLLVWPWPLYFDRAFDLPRGLADPWVLGGLALLAASVGAVVMLRRRVPMASFALAWYGINLLPVSNVVPLTYWFVAERFLYGPSVGFALLCGLGLEAVASTAPRRRLATAIFCGLVLVYSVLTVVQNQVWKDSMSLWSHTLAHNPVSHRALYGYGLQLEGRGERAQAEEYYRKSIAQNPSYEDAHYALSFLLLNEKRYDEAIPEAKLAATLDDDDPEPHMVIGNAEMRLGREEAAVEAYRRVLALAPDHVDALYNLANALYRSGDFTGALFSLDRAVSIRADAETLLYRGKVLRKLGRPEEALASYRRAAEIEPGNPEVLELLRQAGDGVR